MAARYSRRRIFRLATFVPLIAGCASVGLPVASAGESQSRFRGIKSFVLVLDAIANEEMRGVSVFDDLGHQISSASVVARKKRGVMALGASQIPVNVTITWGIDRKFDYARYRWDGGTITGDYTIPVADRIPDEVLDDIRVRGGNLRLKFRLKPDGVLFGWDIERANGGTSKFDSPGGDFLETRY
jgi:hypothetical protein